jgi:hypothetical protein
MFVIMFKRGGAVAAGKGNSFKESTLVFENVSFSNNTSNDFKVCQFFK